MVWPIGDSVSRGITSIYNDMVKKGAVEGEEKPEPELPPLAADELGYVTFAGVVTGLNYDSEVALSIKGYLNQAKQKVYSIAKVAKLVAKDHPELTNDHHLIQTIMAINAKMSEAAKAEMPTASVPLFENLSAKEQQFYFDKMVEWSQEGKYFTDIFGKLSTEASLTPSPGLQAAIEQAINKVFLKSQAAQEDKGLATAGEPEDKSFLNLTEEEQAHIKNWIQANCAGKANFQCTEALMAEFHIQPGLALDEFVTEIWQGLSQKPEDWPDYDDLDDEKKEKIGNALIYHANQGTDKAEAMKDIAATHKFTPDPMFDEIVQYMYDKYGPKEETPKTIEASSIEEAKAILDYIYKLAEAGIEESDVKVDIEEMYGIAPSPGLEVAIAAQFDAYAKIKAKDFSLQPAVTGVAAAIKLIKSGKNYAGCKPVEPGIELNEPLVVYCEGVMTSKPELPGGYVNKPSQETKALMEAAGFLAGINAPLVYQVPNGYSVFATAPQVDGKVWEGIDLIYRDTAKSGSQWKERQKAIYETLEEELNYDCGLFGDMLKCSYPVTAPSLMPSDKYTLRTTALFMSSLHDIDKLEEFCVPDAVEFAMLEAKHIASHTNEPWKQTPSPYTVSEWNHEVCDKLPEAGNQVRAVAEALGAAGLR